MAEPPLMLYSLRTVARAQIRAAGPLHGCRIVAELHKMHAAVTSPFRLIDWLPIVEISPLLLLLPPIPLISRAAKQQHRQQQLARQLVPECTSDRFPANVPSSGVRLIHSCGLCSV